MKIILDRNNKRILKKYNGDQVNINNGDIIQYTGIYYKTINDIVKMVEIETDFVGLVDFGKTTNDVHFTGIYVKPLYIRDQIKNEWNKIVSFTPRTDESFLYYPHLLVLPETPGDNGIPLEFLHTCENVKLDKFVGVYKCFSLDM
jgi:hypothetical protein